MFYSCCTRGWINHIPIGVNIKSNKVETNSLKVASLFSSALNKDLETRNSVPKNEIQNTMGIIIGVT